MIVSFPKIARFFPQHSFTKFSFTIIRRPHMSKVFKIKTEKTNNYGFFHNLKQTEPEKADQLYRYGDPFIQDEVIKLNAKHRRWWSKFETNALRSRPLYYLEMLKKQDMELCNLPKVKAIRSVEAPNYVRSSVPSVSPNPSPMDIPHFTKEDSFSFSPSPYFTPSFPSLSEKGEGQTKQIDILILRETPSFFCAKHGDPFWNNEEDGLLSTNQKRTDYQGWLKALADSGLKNEEIGVDINIHVLFYLPFCRQDKKKSADASANLHKVFGWRFSLMLWLMAPRYILATNKWLSTLVRAKFEITEMKKTKPLDFMYMLSVDFIPKLLKSGGKPHVSRCLRIPHFYYAEKTPHMQPNFNGAVNALIAALKDERKKINDEKIDFFSKLVKNALTGPPLLVNQASTVPGLSSDRQPFPYELTHPRPKWLSIADWYMFSKPTCGMCKCRQCGGCGATHEMDMSEDIDEVENWETLLPPRSSFKTIWTAPSFKCEYCQCSCGHRSLDFNECEKRGCPVGGFQMHHRELLPLSNVLTPKEFVDEYLSK